MRGLRQTQAHADDSIVGQTATSNGPNATSPTDAAAPVPPSRIRCLYEGGDHRLCLFETADGHLVSVKAARLA